MKYGQKKGPLRGRRTNGRDPRLMRLSFFDPFTGLPNRQLLLYRLGQTIRSAQQRQQRFAVMVVGLDDLKALTDTHGQTAGAQLLEIVAKRIEDATGESDTVARLGRDLFAILLGADDDADVATEVADRVAGAFEAPFTLGDKRLTLACTIGIAMFPEHGEVGEILLSHADEAMRRIRRGPSNVGLCNHAAAEPLQRRSMFSQGLRRAVDGHQLLVNFQPQIDVADGRLTAVEALVRWRHPQLGLIGPDKFIPAAERTSMMEAVTLNVLEQSLWQNRQWREIGLEIPIAVNLSTRVLTCENLDQRVADLLRRYEIPAGQLCLEVTETGIMHSPDAAARLLYGLADIGIEISIDDFGTGYSSLKYLQQFPFDEITVDKDFVNGLAGSGAEDKIVCSIIALGKFFDVRVVAEGVESAAALARLGELGCDRAQGFYIGRPMTVIEFERWLQQQPPTSLTGNC